MNSPEKLSSAGATPNKQVRGAARPSDHRGCPPEQLWLNLRTHVAHTPEFTERSSLGRMTFCVKWYLPNKRQIRTHPRLGTSSDFVVLAVTAGLEPGTAFYHGKKVIG